MHANVTRLSAQAGLPGYAVGPVRHDLPGRQQRSRDLVDSQHDTPDIKREQLRQRPDLTDDTSQHQQEEAKYGKSIPLVVGLVALIFVIAAVIAAVLI